MMNYESVPIMVKIQYLYHTTRMENRFHKSTTSGIISEIRRLSEICEAKFHQQFRQNIFLLNLNYHSVVQIKETFSVTLL